MESINKLKKSATELYAYIESARSLARQSLVVEAYFKLQGTVTKFFELKEAIDAVCREAGVEVLNDSNTETSSNPVAEGNPQLQRPGQS
jgi:hypothetical protein